MQLRQLWSVEGFKGIRARPRNLSLGLALRSRPRNKQITWLGLEARDRAKILEVTTWLGLESPEVRGIRDRPLNLSPSLALKNVSGQRY